MRMGKIIEEGAGWEEYKEIKRDLQNMRETKAKRLIEKMRITKIQDQMEDINKREQMKKRGEGKQMEKIKIDGIEYKGTDEIIEGLEKKLEEDLK